MIGCRVHSIWDMRYSLWDIDVDIAYETLAIVYETDVDIAYETPLGIVYETPKLLMRH